jgi:DNA-binding NarL/FixJ family response regulator
MSIKVFIVDDHQLFIDGLKSLFNRVTDITVVGEALSAKECLEKLKNMDVEVLVTDINMPNMKGDELVGFVKRLYPKIRILTLSMHDDYGHIDTMIRAGVLGYVLKNTGAKELQEAIRFVYSGQTYYSPRVQDAIIKGYSKEKVESFSKVANIEEEIILTPREVEVVKLVIKGFSSTEIAEILGISYHTITSHRKNINAKLGTTSLVEISKIVTERGLI